MLVEARPEQAGISPHRLREALEIPQEWAAGGKVPGAAVLVARKGRVVAEVYCGNASPSPQIVPVTPETIFLIASITKPMTATAALILLERGKLRLHDTVASIIPEFGRKGKEGVRILHLLTHTSGLPDMLPENTELRTRHQPLDEFIHRIYEVELDFQPGARVQYQSCGIAILGEIIRRLDGRSLPEFLQEEVFAPLGMADSTLGAPPSIWPRLAICNISETDEATDYNWNTEYWRSFAAPWGGAFSTVRDIARFLQLFLNLGRVGEAQILSPATARLMTSNLTYPLVPDSVGGTAWGLGWEIKAGVTESYFGDLASPTAFGHGGATGTLAFADPELHLACVVLTNQPGACSPALFGPLCNAVIASIVD